MTTNKHVKILNCKFIDMNKGELLDTFNEGVLMPTNVDMVVKMQKDIDFFKCFQSAEFCVNDSQIITFAARFLGTPIKETISGSDIFPLFYQYHKNNNDITIFLMGAADGVAEKAKNKINALVGREMVVGCYSPPFGFEKDTEECEKIIEMINNSKATTLAIGVGAPKQEKWIFKHKHKLKYVKKFLCIGATIDFEAGNIKRAPKVFRSIGLEWFYRLVNEPRRLWKRYLVDDVPFIFLLMKQKLGFYSDPFSGQNKC